MEILNKIDAVLGRINNTMMSVGVALLVFAWTFSVYEVVARYFFNAPTTWTVGLTEYLLVYLAFLGAGWVEARDLHIRVDIVVNQLNKRTQAIVHLVTSSVGVVVFFIVFYFAAVLTGEYVHTGELPSQNILSIPKWAVIGIIPVGSFLLSVQCLRSVIRRFEEYRKADREARAPRLEDSIPSGPLSDEAAI